MMSVSVLISTRGRGGGVVATLQSVLANRYSDFEVVLVDQNDDRETEAAVEPFRTDPRFAYLRTDTRGKGSGLNVGLSQAQGEFLLFTDDDCRVPSNWIEAMCAAFEVDEQIGVVFCNVEAGPHDASRGFVPCYINRRDQLVRSVIGRCHARGLGAGMAARREVVVALGGFDGRLGPGAHFPSAEDWDLAIRALLRGIWVYETAKVAVTHDGFRTWQQGKALAERNCLATGAMLGKLLNCRCWELVPVLAYEMLLSGLRYPFAPLLHLRRPSGLRGFLYLWLGVVHGLLAPVDPRTLRFRPDARTDVTVLPTATLLGRDN